MLQLNYLKNLNKIQFILITIPSSLYILKDKSIEMFDKFKSKKFTCNLINIEQVLPFNFEKGHVVNINCLISYGMKIKGNGNGYIQQCPINFKNVLDYKKIKGCGAEVFVNYLNDNLGIKLKDKESLKTVDFKRVFFDEKKLKIQEKLKNYLKTIEFDNEEETLYKNTGDFLEDIEGYIGNDMKLFDSFNDLISFINNSNSSFISIKQEIVNKVRKILNSIENKMILNVFTFNFNAIVENPEITNKLSFKSIGQDKSYGFGNVEVFEI